MVDGVAVTYYPLPARSWGTFYYAPELAQACRARVAEYDLVFLESVWGHIAGPASAACQRHRVPYIVAPRGQLLPWALSKKNLKKRLYLALFARRYLDGAAAIRCTDPLEAEAVAALNVRPPTFVVPNSVDVARFAALPPRRHLRDRLGIPAEAQVLLFLGRLHPKKRPDIAVAALIAAQDLPGEVHLVMAGPDEASMTAELRAQASQAGCDHRLHIVGLLAGDDVLQALAAADLLLMPSEPQSENFGMSAVEALAAGVPVLVSDGVPVGTWAQSDGAGCQIPCEVDAFQQKTRALLRDPCALHAMGQHGVELVRRTFDTASVTRELLDYCQIIASIGTLG